MGHDRAFWLAWSQIQGVGPVLLKRLQGHFGTLASAWEASPAELQAVEGIGIKLAGAIAQQRHAIRPDPQAAAQDASQWITPADEAYPRLLFEIPDPPPVLYYRGDLGLLRACQVRPAVGIVGTRSPSDYGRRWTQRLSATLAQAGIVILSGLAEGIDRVAHQSCLDRQGHTIAVLGTGVDGIYPRSNRDLQGAIARSGLLLSEYPDGTPPDRSHFPRRNRIIAGLSRAVIVTEAPIKSGALITAKLANDYGRDVYVLPGSLDNDRCRGCLALLNQGAQLILDEASLLQSLGEIPVETVAASEPEPLLPPDLPPSLERVLQAVTGEAISLDAIVDSTQNLATGDVLSALTQLELLGLVTQLPGQQYQRCA